jgi:2-haloacid dehalogenase
MTIGAGARFMTFDCYGTLIDFQMTRTIGEVFGPRLPADRARAFITLASACRFDEVLGPWKPYRDVIRDATSRAATLLGIEYRDEDGDRLYEAIGTWGPHPDVPAALRALATRYPLVIMSNAHDPQLAQNVARLGAPFHKVLTAEQARAYKPRFAAFLYMLDELGCRPDEVIHVSSSIEYDHRPAADLGIGTRVFVNRGHSQPQPWLGYHEIRDLAALPALLGIEPAARAARENADANA